MLKVVDLNHWKGQVNISALGVDAMITKATGGNGYVDDTCDNNVQQAIALGMPWGVFHYFSDGFNDGDPIAEANWFISNCQGYLGKGQIWLDWERAGNPFIDRVDMALAWLEHVRTTTGFKPAGIYMSNSVVTAYDWSPVINAGYALWDAAYVYNSTPIANFNISPTLDPNPKWDGVVNDVMWQFTSTGQLNGYNGNLDCSLFFGDRNAWQAYINVPAPAPAPPPPAPAPQPVVETHEETDTKPVPFSKKQVDDPTLDKGVTKITQAGVDGVETIVYEVTTTDGTETGRTVKSDTITTQPVDEITSVGTKEPTPTPQPPTPQPKPPTPAPKPPAPSPKPWGSFNWLYQIFKKLGWVK